MNKHQRDAILAGLSDRERRVALEIEKILWPLSDAERIEALECAADDFGFCLYCKRTLAIGEVCRCREEA